jgi:hypothetical protein
VARPAGRSTCGPDRRTATNGKDAPRCRSTL